MGAVTVVRDSFVHCFLRIAPQRIHYLKFILEAYDGLALLSTVDSRQGLVSVHYHRAAHTELFELLVDLAPSLVATPCSTASEVYVSTC